MVLIFEFILIVFSIILKKKKSNINFFPFIIISLILIVGLKDGYGVDYDNYLTNFNELNSLKDVFLTNFEKGYALLAFLFKRSNLGFNTLLLAIGFVSLSCKGKSINKLSPMPEVSLLIFYMLFFVFNDLEQIRHGIAAGLCFYSLCFLIEENKRSKIIAFTLISIATSFHYSAIFFFIVFIVSDRVFLKKTYIFIFIISLVISMLNIYQVLNIVNDLFFHNEYISAKLALYDYSASNNDFLSVISSTLLIKVFILVIYGKFAFNKKVMSNRLLFNMYFIGIMITCVFNSSPIIAVRGSLFMRYAEIIMIPSYILKVQSFEKKKVHYVIIAVIFIYYIAKFVQVLINPIYFNYTSI